MFNANGTDVYYAKYLYTFYLSIRLIVININFRCQLPAEERMAKKLYSISSYCYIGD